MVCCKSRHLAERSRKMDGSALHKNIGAVVVVAELGAEAAQHEVVGIGESRCLTASSDRGASSWSDL
jgi:hypothetical protein